MITVTFNGDEERIKSDQHVYQWDTGQKITVSGLGNSAINKVHFTFKGLKTAYVVNTTNSSGTITVDIPDIVLRYGKDVYAYLCIKNSTGKVVTIKTVIIPVIKRNMPENYMYDDDETVATSLDELQAEIQRSTGVDTDHETRITSLEGAKTNVSGKTFETLKARIDADVNALNEDLNNTIYSETLINKTIAQNSSGFVESATADIKKGEIIRFSITADSPVTMFYQVYYTDGTSRDYDLNVNKYMMNYEHIVTKPVNTVRVYRNNAIYSDVTIKIDRISSIDVVKEELSKDINELNVITNGLTTAFMGNVGKIKSLTGKRITKDGVKDAQNNNWIVDVYDLTTYKGLLCINSTTRFVGDYSWSIFSDSELTNRIKLSTTHNETNEFKKLSEYTDVESGKKFLAVQAYNNPTTVKKMYESGERYDFKKKCSRITDNGIYSKVKLVSQSGSSVKFVDDGLNEFGEMTKKIFITGTSEAYFFVELENPIAVADFESVTIRMKLPLYTVSSNGEHSGYFGIAPRTTDQGAPPSAQYKVYSNSHLSYGEFTVKIPKSAFITDYFTGDINGIVFRCIPRSSVVDWYGGWSIIDIQVNQKMKPCLLINFDQVWEESINNGGYDLFHNNGIKYTMFTAGYANMDKNSLTWKELKIMEQYGNELSAYGGLIYGASLPASEIMEIVDGNIIDLAEVTDRPMISYGCRQHYGNYKLVNLLRMRGVKAIRMNQDLFPLGIFTKNDYAIPAIEITEQTSADEIIAKIDECITNGSCLPLFTHGICATGQKYMTFNDGSMSTSEGVPLDKMTTIVNHIKSKMDSGELECLTFTEFVNSCY